MEIVKHDGIVCIHEPQINYDKDQWTMKGEPECVQFIRDNVGIGGEFSCSVTDVDMVPMEMREPSRDFTWHDGNLHKEGIVAQVLIPLSWQTDSYQGGEFEFEGFPCTPHRDNFGEWKFQSNQGWDIKYQPPWTNEPGSLTVIPSSHRWGVARVWHGTKKFRVINIWGRKHGVSI